MSEARNDNLRHLRFLHFAIIVVSMLILIASSLRPPTRIADALAQARLLAERADQIIERADGLRVQSCANALRALLGRFEASSPLLGHARRLGFEVRLSEVDDALLSDPPLAARSTSPSGQWRLGEIAATWDAFHRAESKYTIGMVDDPEGLYSVRTVVEPPPLSDEPPRREHEQLAVARGRFDGPNREAGGVVHASLRHDERFDQHELLIESLEFADDATGARWVITFDSPLALAVGLRRVGDVQAELIAALELPRAGGSFAASFPALASAARGLESVTLDELVAHLAHRATEEASSVGLLFGTMPLATLRTWGALLLCCIQVYFAVHLVQHRAEMATAMASRDFSWIALYRSFAAQAATTSTAVALPVCVVVYVVNIGEAAPASVARSLLTWLIVAGSLGSAAAAFVQLVHVHRAPAVEVQA